MNWNKRPRVLAACTLLVLACSRCAEVDGPTNEPVLRSLQGLIVSEPRTPAASSVGATQGDVAYVSLPAGTLPLAASVQIRNQTTGSFSTGLISVVDGGFDPVPVQARVGDVLEVTITLFSGATETFSARVPPRRPPAIVRTNPPKGRTDVALSIRPTAVFSEPVDPTTITATSVRLIQGTASVAGNVSLQPGSLWAAEFTPAAPLQPGLQYELIVTRDVRDLDGDALDAQITSTFITSASVTSTPDPRIAFVSNRSGTAYIYVANADGSNVMLLTPGEDPAWSWDGRRIAFRRADGIYVIAADGSGLNRLAPHGRDPTWSPDGKRIAFTGIVGQDGGIYVMNDDGSNVSLLIRSNFENEGDYVDAATWSPDGRFIAFMRSTPYYDGQIYIMNADGSQPRRLLTATGDEPSWSPDGSTIVFADYWGIGAVNADGSGFRFITHTGIVWDPDWSPDGSQVVFQKFSGPPIVGSPFGSRLRIHVTTIADGSIRQLIPDAVGVVNYRDEQAVWSRVIR